jgi:hypothetical protein
VIQELNHACVERGAVIAQLAASDDRPHGLPPQALDRPSPALIRDKVAPRRQMAFPPVVETYWMQIGILRQYEPRPIAWDTRLPVAGQRRHPAQDRDRDAELRPAGLP